MYIYIYYVPWEPGGQDGRAGRRGAGWPDPGLGERRRLLHAPPAGPVLAGPARTGPARPAPRRPGPPVRVAARPARPARTARPALAGAWGLSRERAARAQSCLLFNNTRGGFFFSIEGCSDMPRFARLTSD
jgi:hypothetical protein